MLAKPGSPDAEGFRMLRTNLEFARIGRDIKSVMVTSAVQSEGKSTTVANLAVAFARAGSRVVLVDLDLRRPTLERVFALSPGPGLTDVTLGRATLKDALRLVELPAPTLSKGNGQLVNGRSPGRLEVLRSGLLPPDPGEFVTSPRVAELLQGLRDRADIILIDAPPVLQAGDTMSLSSAVDALFLITRMPLVRRQMLDGLKRAMAASPALVLGVVLTGQQGVDRYGYGYGYGYGDAVDPDASANTEPEPSQVPTS